MASPKKFLVSINLNKNELQNFVVHNLASAPTSPSEGQAYFNTGDSKFYMYINSYWVDITGNVTVVTSSTPALTVDLTDPSAPDLTIADADGTNSGLLTSAFYNDLLNATSNATANTLVKRDANGDASFNELTVTTGITVGGESVATETFVNNLVSSGMTIKGDIDASTNPNYPAAIVGDSYHITVAGKIGGASGEDVEIGDMIVCKTDSGIGGDHASVGGDWYVLQANVGQATETVIGLSRIATSAEVTAGVNDSTYITPLKLANALSGLGIGNVNKFVAVIGDGTNTSFNTSHNLGEQYCNVQVYDAVSNEEVIADIQLENSNNAKVKFNQPPTLNQYRVVIAG